MVQINNIIKYITLENINNGHIELHHFNRFEAYEDDNINPNYDDLYYTEMDDILVIFDQTISDNINLSSIKIENLRNINGKKLKITIDGHCVITKNTIRRIINKIYEARKDDVYINVFFKVKSIKSNIFQT